MNLKFRTKLNICFIPILLAIAMVLFPLAGRAQSLPRKSGLKLPAEEAAKIRTAVEATLRAWNVPGAAVGIVKDGRAVFLEGFGKRDLEKGLPVTPQTRFILGSTTKAFTTMVIGLLEAENKLDWDKPVSSYIPDFGLMDEYASFHATIRDLAAHRTGLPRHDIVWVNSPMDLGDMVRSLRFLEPSRELRAAFQYNNLMYITLGYLVEKAAGIPWDACVREKVFRPLGMTQSGCTVPEYIAAGEYAFSYSYKEKKHIAQPLPQPAEKLMYGARASGSVNTTAEDMCRWMTVHLQAGKVDGNQIFPPDVVREMHTPQIPIPWNPATAAEIVSPSYALGWMTDTYRGHWRVHHGGSTLEFNSYVSLFPQAKTGIVVLINASSPASSILAQAVSDLALGLSPIDWTKRAEEQMKAGRQSGPQEKRVEGTVPAHKLEDYEGEYLHPAYGTLTVGKKNGTLRAALHGFELSLEHWHYEAFAIAGGEFRGQKLTFQTNAAGAVSAVSGSFEPAVKDIVFERRPKS